jgi:hypothetical protein
VLKLKLATMELVFTIKQLQPSIFAVIATGLLIAVINRVILSAFEPVFKRKSTPEVVVAIERIITTIAKATIAATKAVITIEGFIVQLPGGSMKLKEVEEAPLSVKELHFFNLDMAS